MKELAESFKPMIERIEKVTNQLGPPQMCRKRLSAQVRHRNRGGREAGIFQAAATRRLVLKSRKLASELVSDELEDLRPAF